ncbi:MAG: DNA alkylation repair protein [Anaeroplasmataceae bacterium]|nr:DNA alkylation repair protein [Anaeroplasmataceae bacterium]
MIEEIKQILNQESKENTKEFNQKILNTKLPILGVNTPFLRQYAKQICKQDFRLFLKECDRSSYELTLLEAFVIAGAKMSIDERFKLLDEFIPIIGDWAVHDGLVSSLKCSKKYPKEMLEYILKYKDSTKEFEVRFVAVMLMVYYLNEEYADKAFEVVKTLKANDYYAKMGIAWFLATAMIEYPEKVYSYLDNTSDKDIILMTIRKVRDSYRVSPMDKEKILQYK